MFSLLLKEFIFDFYERTFWLFLLFRDSGCRILGTIIVYENTKDSCDNINKSLTMMEENSITV